MCFSATVGFWVKIIGNKKSVDSIKSSRLKSANGSIIHPIFPTAA